MKPSSLPIFVAFGPKVFKLYIIALYYMGIDEMRKRICFLVNKLSIQTAITCSREILICRAGYAICSTLA